MMRAAVAMLATIAGVFAASVVAADASQPTPPPKKHGFDPNAIICKTIWTTSTHLPGERVCLTWAQWDAQSQADQQTLSDALRRPGASRAAGSGGPGGGSSGSMH